MGKVVYFIRAGKEGPVKVGWASNIKSRFRQIAQGLPDLAVLEATLPGGIELEKRIHRALHQSRRRLEWFNPTKEVSALIVVAKNLGLEAVERWLEVKEAEVQPRKPDFTESDDFDADIRWLIAFSFKSAVERHGYDVVCETVGKTYNCVNGYVNGRSVPDFLTGLRLADIDPGVLAPLFARAGDVPAWAQSDIPNNQVRAA